MNNLCVIFDLDDTLYKEIDFLKSGYRFIANQIQPSDSEKAFTTMMNAFFDSKNAFETVNKEFELDISTEQYLEWYRFHCPSISMSEEVYDTLLILKNSGAIIGIISDGRSKTQRNKIEALGLLKFIKVEDIVISEEFGSEKPDKRNYLHFMEKYPDCTYIYVGDNPAKDFIAPNALGWLSIMILDDGRNIHKQGNNKFGGEWPKKSIQTFRDLTNIIAGLEI